MQEKRKCNLRYVSFVFVRIRTEQSNLSRGTNIDVFISKMKLHSGPVFSWAFFEPFKSTTMQSELWFICVLSCHVGG